MCAAVCDASEKLGEVVHGIAKAMVWGALAMMGNAWACNRVAMGSADK